MTIRTPAALIALAVTLVGCESKPGTKTPDSATAKATTPNVSTPPSNATAKWMEIARTPESVFYLDTARIERPADGAPRIWYRFVWLKGFTMGTDTTHYSASEVYEELDCKLARTKMLQVRMEVGNGVSVAAPTPDLKWRDIATDPMHSGISKISCRALGTPLPTPRG